MAMVQVSFNKKGETTVSILDSAGTDPTLSRELSDVINEKSINRLRFTTPTEYKTDHAFLKEFNHEVVQPKLVALGAHVIRVESLPYRERMHIFRNSEVAVLDVIYNGKGEITDVLFVRGSQALWSELQFKKT